MRNYTIDFTKKTLTMTRDFAEKAMDPNSYEYKIIAQLKNDFPDLTITRRTHKSPKKANENKGLTYKNMVAFIRQYENSYELLQMFYKVRVLAEAQHNPYLFVKYWFMKQFPNYNELPSFINCKLYVAPIEPKQIEEVA